MLHYRWNKIEIYISNYSAAYELSLVAAVLQNLRMLLHIILRPSIMVLANMTSS